MARVAVGPAEAATAATRRPVRAVSPPARVFGFDGRLRLPRGAALDYG